MKLEHKTDDWWKALRTRKGCNRNHYTGVWQKNGNAYCFDLVYRGHRIRKGGFKTPEEAALARDCVIVANRFPHKRSYGDDHFNYYIDKFGYYEL